MAAPPQDFLHDMGPNFLLFSLEEQATLKVIEKINYIKSLNIGKRTLILTQKNTNNMLINGSNALILTLYHCPEALPPLLELFTTLPPTTQTTIFEQTVEWWQKVFKDAIYSDEHLVLLTKKLIKIVPQAIQEKMFKHTDRCGRNVLSHFAMAGQKFAAAPLKEMLGVVKTFPVTIQGEIFIQLSGGGANVLMDIIACAQWAFPIVLELIKRVPLTIQEEMFQQVDRHGQNILLNLIERIPSAFLTVLRLIKKFSPEVREKIIKQKDYWKWGRCLEFYLVCHNGVAQLETLEAMGFNFNREVKDSLGDGLLELAVRRGRSDILRVLISRYGLKPDIEKLVRCASEPESVKFIYFSPGYLKNLYTIYLNSLNLFVKDQVEREVLPVPKVLFPIILDYLAFDFEYLVQDPQALEALEASVGRAVKLRAEWLKPLFEHCAQEEADAEALACLKALLTPKKLGPDALEKELDALLNQDGLAGKSHVSSLIQCRGNTELLTGTKLGFSVKVKATFQFKVLCAGAAISVLTLAVGLMALCMLNALVAGVAVTALSSIALGGLAYGFYAHKKNTNIPEYVGPSMK